MGSVKHYIIHKVSQLYGMAPSPGAQGAPGAPARLPAGCFHGAAFLVSSFRSVISQKLMLHGVSGRSVKTKIFPLFCFAIRKRVCNGRDAGMPRHVTFLPLFANDARVTGQKC